MAAFERVIVDYFMTGGARVTWTLERRFADPTPHTFQLQVSQSGGASTADDWEDVDDPVVDTFLAIDDDRRMYGKTQTVAYRVKLTTSVDEYYSEPAEVLGQLNDFDWLKVREITRKEQLRHRIFGSVPGWLLKAKRYGTVCDCVDSVTGEVTDGNCATCFGTGYVDGYFPPIAAYYADLAPENSREALQFEYAGTEKKVITSGRMIGVPLLVKGDAWVNNGSDERYYIHSVKELATWKSVPVIYQVELRLAAFTDPLYQVEIDQ